MFCGLATVARERDYCRPVVDDSRALQVRDGRHPVIEATHTAGSFVPNDTDFDPPQRRLVVLTGPSVRVHHNTIHLPEKWVLRILQESQGERFPPCRECVFEHNLVVFDRRVRSHVNVGAGTAPDTFTFRGNAWFCVDGDARPRLPVAEDDGVHGVDPKLENAGTAEMQSTAKDRRLRDVGVRGYRRGG